MSMYCAGYLRYHKCITVLSIINVAFVNVKESPQNLLPTISRKTQNFTVLFIFIYFVDLWCGSDGDRDMGISRQSIHI